MKNQRQMWTSEEEEALKSGVAKYGTGRWKNILTDPDLSSFFNHRTNIDLKDKWRNLTPRVKAITAGPVSSAQSSASASPIAKAGPCKNQLNGKTASWYSDMIFEALLTISDSNGCDLGAIVGSIERRHEVPQNFIRLLGSNLRKLVLQGKLEKIQNCYKIKDAALGTKTPSPKQNGIRSRPSQKPVKLISSETLEDAAATAACMIAEAENKSLVAAEAVREAERVSNMAENAESVLQLVKQFYEQYLQGEIVVLA